MREIVVCTHGIWMNSWVMQPLAYYLRNRGHHCKQFNYQSVSHSPKENAHKLSRFVDHLEAETIHFVAHSLGGILLSHYFDQNKNAKPGRVVMLGTPLAGSKVAQHLAKNQLIRMGLGASASALIGNVPAWDESRPLAIFAGTRGHGIGKLLGAKLDGLNDGTVAVDETRIENCTLHIKIPYSHSQMLMAKPVAAAVDEFLRTGTIKRLNIT